MKAFIVIILTIISAIACANTETVASSKNTNDYIKATNKLAYYDFLSCIDSNNKPLGLSLLEMNKHNYPSAKKYQEQYINDVEEVRRKGLSSLNIILLQVLPYEGEAEEMALEIYAGEPEFNLENPKRFKINLINGQTAYFTLFAKNPTDPYGKGKYANSSAPPSHYYFYFQIDKGKKYKCRAEYYP